MLRPLTLLVTLPLVMSALAGCGEDPPAVGQPRPVLSAPNQLDSASGLTDAEDVQLVNVTFVDGTLTGDVGGVDVVLGSPLRVTVVTDIVDTVVIEGFDQRILTAVDQPVQIELVASEAGEFDVELERSGTLLTTLDVS